MRSRSARPLLLSLALPLTLGGCSLGSVIPLPATKDILEKVPLVENSTKSPCWQQEQIAAQRSYIASALSGKEIIYQAPCKVDRQEPNKVNPSRVAAKS
jgi:hypothetical protein